VPARAGRVSVTITREDLDIACGDLYETTTEIIERVLAAAHVDGVPGIDEVIMVGGSSRIPVLAERMTEMLGKKPRLVEPDLAVAKGAALRAHHIVRTPQMAALTASRGSGATRFLTGSKAILIASWRSSVMATSAPGTWSWPRWRR
jgi:molecular chaperone DnaK (HSP70)